MRTLFTFLVASLCSLPLAKVAHAGQAGPARGANARFAYRTLVPTTGKRIQLHVNVDGKAVTHSGQLHSLAPQTFKIETEWGTKIEIRYSDVKSVKVQQAR